MAAITRPNRINILANESISRTILPSPVMLSAPVNCATTRPVTQPGAGA